MSEMPAAPFDPGSGNAETEQRFRERAQAFGIKPPTIERMALAPKRALACVEEARRRGTGPGLAVHMFDAGDDPSLGRAKPHHTNGHAAITDCAVCGGDRFIVASTRKPQQSAWMREHGITPSATQEIEVMAPCPECGPVVSHL